MNNLLIPQEELQKLASSTIKHISVQSLGQWIKSKTENDFIVIERNFIIDAIQYIERNRYTDEFIGQNIKEKWDLEIIRIFL
jgi:hypothetical protein